MRECIWDTYISGCVRDVCMGYMQQWVCVGVCTGYTQQWVCKGIQYGVHASVGV